MPTVSNKPSLKKSSSTRATSRIDRWIVTGVKKTRQRIRHYQARRPHRSFRRTYRRDYVRSMKMPGYIAFSTQVGRLLIKNWRLFSLVAGLYILAMLLIVGLTSQDIYRQIADLITVSTDNVLHGSLGKVGQAALTVTAVAISGSSRSQDTGGAQAAVAVIILLMWLLMVYLLRHLTAGNRVKLRDGVYNSGSPIVSTFLVSVVLLLELLPITLAVYGYGAAVSSGILSGGVEAMVFWFAAALLGLISVYWLTGGIFALIIVTIPGMYPIQAIRISGDIVIGRRLRIILRILWALLLAGLGWFVVVVPIALLDNWLSQKIGWLSMLPVVPFIILVMSTVAFIWLSSYMYMLYRKVVDDDAKPA